jgi:hypothetical protein
MESAIEVLYEEFADELMDESNGLDNVVIDPHTFNQNETDYDLLNQDDYNEHNEL